jgi:3-hydroxyisobutyrate dehydrogenase-like beta-hydroxyacid dehydrogenase
VAADNIGLIGLGLLGSAMAKRLIGAGFAVYGFDIDEDRRSQLGSIGGQTAQSASEVAETCTCIIFSLPNSGVAGTVLSEIEPKLRDGAIIIDTTTGDPDEMAGFGRRLAEGGRFYLDATVGGSSRLVEAGEAIVIVGGDAGAYQSCSGILGRIGRQVFHIGPCGSGARMKLVLNLVLGLNRAVLAEGLTFASRYGLSRKQTLEILKAGPSYSRVMDLKGDKMLAGEFEPEARLSQHLKDVRLILAAGKSCGAKLPLSALHSQLLEQAEAIGFGGADNSAIIKSFE